MLEFIIYLVLVVIKFDHIVLVVLTFAMSRYLLTAFHSVDKSKSSMHELLLV